MALKKSKLTRKKGINRVSSKRKADNVLYRQAKEEWREERIIADGYWQCEWVGKPFSPTWTNNAADDDGRCISNAIDLHHKRKRGKYLSDKRFFMGVCRFHHQYLHDHGREARRRGYLLT